MSSITHFCFLIFINQPWWWQKQSAETCWHYEMLGELSARVQSQQVMWRMLNGLSSWATQQSYCIRIDIKHKLPANLWIWREEKVHPLPNKLKFFNAVIHISHLTLGKVSHTINLFSAAPKHVVVFSFIEHFYGDVQGFNWKIS